jgi:hypothetical protein
MNGESSIDTFWVLYLVNIHQPVDLNTLVDAAKKLLAAVPDRSEPIDVRTSLQELLDSGLVMLRSDKLIVVTILGLERLSQFKFGRIRDKNRLFVLKQRLKKS